MKSIVDMTEAVLFIDGNGYNEFPGKTVIGGASDRRLASILII